MSDPVSLVLDATGLVVASLVGAPANVPVPPGATAVAMPADVPGVGIGWRHADGAWANARPAPAPPTPADLLAYANRRRKELSEGVGGSVGRTVPVLVGGVACPFPIDATTRAALGDAAFQTTLPGGDTYAVTAWLLPTGRFVSLDAEAIMAAAKAVAAAFQALFTAQAQAFAAIAAGTATTTAQVDAILGG